MSLIVAQVIGAGPWIVSDTRVTDLDGRSSTPDQGTLKTVVISPDIAVGFAGNLDIGTEAIRRFEKALVAGTTVQDVLPLLAAQTSSDLVEFLVAKNESGPSLTRIRRGEIEHELLTAWIGDAAAFQRFQEERLRPPDGLAGEKMLDLEPGQQAICALENAMEAVIDDRSVDSVGGFAVTIGRYGRTRALNYHGSAFMHVGRDFQFEGPVTVHQLIRPVEEGGYAVCVVEPAEGGIPALGLSFPQARLAMVFLPLQFERAQVLRDVGVGDFVRVMQDQFHVRFAEPMLSSTAKVTEPGIRFEGRLFIGGRGDS